MQQLDGSIPTAFHAVQGLAFDSAYGDMIVPYQWVNKVGLNAGNLMDNENGVYSAARRGVYYFTFSATRVNHEKFTHFDDCTVQILRNNQEVVGVTRVDTMPNGQIIAQLPLLAQSTLLLDQGDKVSARLLKNCGLTSAQYNLGISFSGFLIVPLSSQVSPIK